MARGKDGINSEALKEQNRKVVFMDFLAKLSDKVDEIREMQAEAKGIKKKAALYGIKAKSLDYALKSLEAGNQQTPVDEYREHGEILSYLGIMPQFQPALMLDRTPADERIAAEGERQGLLGRARNAEYAKGSKEEQWWLTGFDKGSKLRMERLADALDEAQEPTSAAGKAALVKQAAEAKKNPAAPLGDLPPESTKAKEAEPAKPSAAPAAKKRAKPGDVDGGKTNAEKEAERQAKGDFVH